MDQLQKMRLKVYTNTDLNLLCTVSKDWTVQKLYPHITRLYREVTKDQGRQQYQVNLTTLKKNNFYVPKSQIVGEVFVDGDQVTCTVDIQPIKHISKSQIVKEKKKEKDIEYNNLKTVVKSEQSDMNQQPEVQNVKPKKNRSKKKVENKQQQNHQQNKQQFAINKIVAPKSVQKQIRKNQSSRIQEQRRQVVVEASKKQAKKQKKIKQPKVSKSLSVSIQQIQKMKNMIKGLPSLQPQKRPQPQSIIPQSHQNQQ